MKFCSHCGKEILDEAIICPGCGCSVEGMKKLVVSENKAQNEKNWLTLLLLCIFLGGLGAHRFYVGKIGTGVLWLFTAGCFGIGAIIDLISIICGKFEDINGSVIKREV